MESNSFEEYDVLDEAQINDPAQNVLPKDIKNLLKGEASVFSAARDDYFRFYKNHIASGEEQESTIFINARNAYNSARSDLLEKAISLIESGAKEEVAVQEIDELKASFIQGEERWLEEIRASITEEKNELERAVDLLNQTQEVEIPPSPSSLRGGLLEAKERYQFVDAPGRDPRQVAVERVEARAAYMAALADFLYAKVKELETKVRILRAEKAGKKAQEDTNNEYVDDPEFQNGIEELFQKYVIDVGREMKELDPSFNAVVAVLSDPELTVFFGEKIETNTDVLEPTIRPMFELAITERFSEEVEDTLGEARCHKFYNARALYFSALLRQMMGAGVAEYKELEKNYAAAKKAIHTRAALQKRNLNTQGRAALDEALSSITVRDAALKKEIEIYWLTDTRKNRVVPTAEKMKMKKGSVWRRVALFAGALLGLGVPTSTHRDTYEPAYETSSREVETDSVEVRAHSFGAIETFTRLLKTPDDEQNVGRTLYLRESLHELMRGLGVDEHATIEVQANQIAERLGFVSKKEELLTDADFTGENIDPLIYEGSSFVFNPEIGTLIVRMPNGIEQILVVNNLKVADYQE